MILNGTDISELGLVSLEGNLDVLQKPSEFKKLPINDNSSLDGVLMLHSPFSRRRKERNISLGFLLRSSSAKDLMYALSRIENRLIGGKDNTGLNELYVPLLDTKYFLVYDSMNKYSNFGTESCATIYLKFIEPYQSKQE